jgi:LysM repeat protein/ABC-type branched-subunit amino acid transport system substrate-binding protein
MRYLSLLVLLFVFAGLRPVAAQEITVKRSSVIENYKGKPYYIHFVQSGETLQAIAEAYKVSTKEILAENPEAEKQFETDMALRIPQHSGITVPEPPPAVSVQPEPIVPQTQVKPQEKPQEKPVNDGYTLYPVKKKETLYGISKQFGVTVDDILKANPGFESLKEGMEIRIPVKKAPVPQKEQAHAEPEHPATPAVTPDQVEVKPGETLYSLSKQYHTTVDDLIDLNPELKGGLKAGMVLKLRKTEPVKENANPAVKENVSKPAAENVPVKVVSVPGDCFQAENRDHSWEVALLLPFMLEESAGSSETPADKETAGPAGFEYMQFYTGFMMAADSLAKMGLLATIRVLDAEKLNDTLLIRQTLRKPGLDKADLIVGPVYASSFTIAARFAKKNSIPIVNPLSRRENITDDNPFVIKAQVSAKGTAAKLKSYITAHYPDANIVAVRNDAKEMQSVVAEFTSVIRAGIEDKSFAGSLEESTFANDNMAGVVKKLKKGATNIVIFFSNNKSGVPNFVSLLNPHAKASNIVLFGMDGWDELELETEFLVNLNFHQLSSTYVDYDSDEVKSFVNSFKARTGTVPLPSKHAFLGYDLGWYFLTSLMWYGDQFPECIPGRTYKGLEYNFGFHRDKEGDGLQNNDISILKLQDYRMVPVK